MLSRRSFLLVVLAFPVLFAAAAPSLAAERDYWRHTRGHFENTSGDTWVERSSGVTHRYVEMKRTEDYVELYDSGLDQSLVVAGRLAEPSRHATEVCGWGAPNLLPVESYRQCLHPLPPRDCTGEWGDRHFVLVPSRLPERPQGRGGGVRVGVRHLGSVHASLHPQPLPQGHATFTRLADVVEAHPPDSSGSVQSWFVRDPGAPAAAVVRNPRRPDQRLVDVEHEHRQSGSPMRTKAAQ
jgi:hypothetical protein